MLDDATTAQLAEYLQKVTVPVEFIASLDDSALEAVKMWKFEPAKRMGNAVDVWVEIPIRFKLSPNDSFM